MGNKPQEDIVDGILKALEDGEANIYEIAKRTNMHLKTVTRYMPFIIKIQSRRKVIEEKTTGSSLYHLE